MSSFNSHRIKVGNTIPTLNTKKIDSLATGHKTGMWWSQVPDFSVRLLRNGIQPLSVHPSLSIHFSIQPGFCFAHPNEMLIRSAAAIYTKVADHSLLKLCTPGFCDMPLSCITSSPLTTAPSLLWNLIPLPPSRYQRSQVSVLAHYCSHRTSLPGGSHLHTTTQTISKSLWLIQGETIC